MSDIGTFKFVRNDDGAYLGKGRIRTLETKLENITIRPLDYGDRGRPEDAPSHGIYMATGGENIQVGNAWQRKLERGDFQGRDMYSLSFNDPGLPEWTANLACFPRDNDGNYTVVYNRRRGGAKTDDANG